MPRSGSLRPSARGIRGGQGTPLGGSLLLSGGRRRRSPWARTPGWRRSSQGHQPIECPLRTRSQFLTIGRKGTSHDTRRKRQASTDWLAFTQLARRGSLRSGPLLWEFDPIWTGNHHLTTVQGVLFDGSSNPVVGATVMLLDLATQKSASGFPCRPWTLLDAKESGPADASEAVIVVWLLGFSKSRTAVTAGEIPRVDCR